MELVIENLSKTYPKGAQALKNINLNITNGLFGLLGPNGAGKSTLIKTIATLQKPDSGRITIDKLNVLEEKRQVRRILGYLPQEFRLYKNITAFELLEHIAILKSVRDKEIRRSLCNRVLKQTNLFEFRNKRLGSYSAGMKQRFGVAQAMIGDPKIIIVDEPTAGLDPAERKHFLNALSAISENVIVILSTHIIDDVEEICTSMSVIDKGELKYTGKPSEATEQLRGKIWEKVITRGEESEFQEKYTVLSSRLTEGMVEIHIYSDHNPGTFEPVKPDLEDAYFAILKNCIQNKN
ncbi:MAG: ABC transporter ATP-binding protein [Bacteroidales bacterium]|nr:ABC transporter ATP-binding protein [Bacteroidales bacterium]